MATIDLTPTRSEHARITAYILASHLKGNAYYFGDYWNYTTAQEDAIFATWNKLEALNVGNFEWTSLPPSHRANLIEGLYSAIHTHLVTE